MDYEIELKIKNGRISYAMRKAGISSVAELARTAGVRPGNLYKIINMQLSPLNQYGEWRHAVLKMAEVLNCMPALLFNEQQIEGNVVRNQIQVPMTRDQMAMFLGQSSGPATAEEVEEVVEKRIMLGRAMQHLSAREAQVVNMRMENLRYEDVAKVMKITRERVRIIEAKASKKIKAVIEQIKESSTT
ncbi:sigma-70 region 4 domain protein [Magnetococcus marinus MC-1]|uniref:Sigma-70 region 4 domain protein n=1 Tax=Magnetococcus marinus (strain ATCC BAA-1437 / JCM 17883 / MC-1) TaxID=156889 RepID=A0L757_MAGMM|nr:sigma factor-like helix-turn-helix DNA-binding protein [Magnetococcus marinus]ABK43800.1 sigma-70 region 4 domain protein [Magnetococcus marinus MC-1]